MLNLPVSEIKGVGTKMADDLALMRINTVGDLLQYFPYRYDIHEIKPLSELVHNEQATIEGRVLYAPSLSFYGKKKSRLTLTIEAEHVAIKVVMFNRAFLKNQLEPGDIVTLTGKWDANRLQLTATHFHKGEARQSDDIRPVYSAKGDITTGKLKKLIAEALSSYGKDIPELLPARYLKGYKLPGRLDAISSLHFPENRLALKHARRRFIYEEFLLFQLKMQWFRKTFRESTEGNAKNIDMSDLHSFIDSFPFKPTTAQERAVTEILKDMRASYRMNRLLQGDVGSGKTAVAAICLHANMTAGKQGALMVPTEILAEQHVQSLRSLFEGRARIELLTGSVKGKKRKELLGDLQNGEIDLVVGTHALIQDDVFFADLGLAIVDEQHRFGVEQRRTLREKGLHPDVLFMTATPIPRTLAITAFGDMDVSVLDVMPAGRKEIKTFWMKENELGKILASVQKHVAMGEQAYVICPLIEESDKLDIQNAVDLHQQLITYFPPNIKVGLMHGRLSPQEKEEVMHEFQVNQIQILVSTTVVEVGVNVPNATVMVIYDAERFGLSQLHQLRGRVGRGDKQSYCILIADPKGEVGKERMRIMTETNDGFVLSEEDLKLRGPGDFFGRKQSGLPEFKIADMVHDYRALETARQDAYEIIEQNLLETDSEFRLLANELEKEKAFSEKLD